MAYLPAIAVPVLATQGLTCGRRHTPRPAPPSLPATGPTIATGGLSMQVPLAVVLDAIVRSPPWLHSAGTAVLTFLGAAVILAGFFGLNSGEADDERGRAERWEERQAALQTELGMGEDEEDGLSLDGGGFGSSGSLAGAAAAADGGGYHVAHRAEGGEGEGQGLADLRSR